VVTNPYSSDAQPRTETPPGTHIPDPGIAAAVPAVDGPAGSDAPHGADTGVTAALQTLVLDSEAVHDFLDRLAHYVADHLSTTSRAVFCGITLVRARTGDTVASSSDRAQAMDEIQYTLGDGPCLDAARHHRINHLPDVDDPSAGWPEYRTLIAEHELRSILSVPVPLDPSGDSGCAINVYADSAHAFSDADIESTQRLARETADTVRIAVRIAHLSDTALNLRAAMDSRTTIDLAAGIIMAQNRCSQESAVTILKAASSARNMKLHDLAAAVVTSITAEPTVTHFNNG
jgi:hypothetical protein